MAESERSMLLVAAFDRVASGGGPRSVLAADTPALANRRWSMSSQMPAAFPGPSASGKFDQYKRDIPYATLAHAFQSLTRPC